MDSQTCLLQKQDALVPSLSLLEDTHMRAVVLNEVASLYGLRRLTSFPGGHPASLSRDDLCRVRTETCVVSLKSDGVRYLLYLCTIDGEYKALCIDRCLRIYEIVVWCNEDYFSRRTLFDGELVFDCSTNRLCYQVFDVVVVRGVACRKTRYCDRLQIIHNHVLSDLPEGINDDAAVDEYISSEDKVYCSDASNHMNLRLVPKRFVTWANGRQLWDERNTHPFPNDGLVINFDDCPIRPGTMRNVLKWKPKNAVDVQIDVEHRCVYCRDTGREVLLETVSGRPVVVADNKFVQCIAHREAPATASLIECLIYVEDEVVVLWPMKERTDKTEANDIAVVEATLNAVGDSIAVDELFAAAGAASDLGGVADVDAAHAAALRKRPVEDHEVHPPQTRTRRRRERGT